MSVKESLHHYIFCAPLITLEKNLDDSNLKLDSFESILEALKEMAQEWPTLTQFEQRKVIARMLKNEKDCLSLMKEIIQLAGTLIFQYYMIGLGTQNPEIMSQALLETRLLAIGKAKHTMIRGQYRGVVQYYKALRINRNTTELSEINPITMINNFINIAQTLVSDLNAIYDDLDQHLKSYRISGLMRDDQVIAEQSDH